MENETKWSLCGKSKLATFISVDSFRALVTMGDLERYKEVHEIVLSKFDKEHTEARMMCHGPIGFVRANSSQNQ